MDKGFFITFEGPDGAGKSTQIDRLKLFFTERDLDVLYTREPGGTDIGEKIRKLILDKENIEMEPVTEAFLYASARAQLVRQVLKPAIKEGKIIVCDRYMDSSTAYQGYARGLGDAVAEINKHAIDGLLPDLTFLFILDPEIGKSRIAVEASAALAAGAMPARSAAARRSAVMTICWHSSSINALTFAWIRM